MFSKVKILSTKVLGILILIIGFSNLSNAEPNAANGEKIFKANCTSCHVLGGQLIGPNLIGVKDRWKGREAKLISFVKNSQSVINGGDGYAKNLYEKFNKTVMTSQNLKDDEVKDVLEYVHTGGGGAATASKPAEGASYEKVQSSQDTTWLLILIGGLVLGCAYLLRRMLPKRDKNEVFKHNSITEKINQIMLPVFMFLWIVLILFELAFHTKYIRGEAASDIGIQIDEMFESTAWVTLIVFVGCQLMLFYFAFIYKSKEGNKALHYSHNDRLEFIWTSIPAVVLAGLVLFGFKTWTKATDNPDNHPVVIECYAYQFAWEFRYPGPDGRLGKTNFLLIDMEKNPFGLDFTDPAAQDDYTTKELYMPVNKDVYLKIRSRDVLHAAYFPHFRAQIYASPGMDNRIRFKPIYTTKTYRDRIGNSGFNFELACNQLCGASHFNMRRVVTVVKDNEFAIWQKQFKSVYSTLNPTPAPTQAATSASQTKSDIKKTLN